jgi:hypothetical protein
MPRKDQYILDRPTGRTLRARDGLICVFVAILLLLVLKGQSVRSAGEKMDPGFERSVVLAVGHPAGWIADRFGVHDDVSRLTASLSPDPPLNGPGGFDDTATATGAKAGAVQPVSPDAFDPVTVGAKPVVVPKLSTLLVTGDSLSQPLDTELAQRLAPLGIKTDREVHLGTGISKSALLDWGRESTSQVKHDNPDAIVFFLGANEGFPLTVAGKSVSCCGPAWAAAYATRARQMMNTYRQDGSARVYWLTLPGQRDPARQEIARSVNAAIYVAAQPYRAQVRVLDMTSLFTPGGKYRAAMPIGGKETIVRRPDGIHLNEAGAALAAQVVIARLKADFGSL